MSKKLLRDRLAEPMVLNDAYVQVVSGANPKSFGPDGTSIEQFCRSYKSQLKRLREDLKGGLYRSSAPRGVPIVKSEGKGYLPENVRPISVYDIRDRIVHRAIANLIWPRVRDLVYSNVSFGGIRRYKKSSSRTATTTDAQKNVRSAALLIMQLRSEGWGYTFETDIQRFFPSINKSRLLDQLRAALSPDDSINDLLDAAISTSISNQDEIEKRGLSQCWDPRVGVPQGGVLSPLFANLYLAPFDKAMIDHGFNLVRYVDDLVVLTKSRSEAERAFVVCKQELQILDLTIHELNQKNEKGKVKTKIVDYNQPFEFLGLKFNKASIHPSTSKLDDLRTRIEEATHAKLGSPTLIGVVQRLNSMLKGWTAAYSFCDTSTDTLRQIDHWARTGVAGWMKEYKLISNLNALTPAKATRLGLWSVQLAEIQPISKQILSKSASATAGGMA